MTERGFIIPLVVEGDWDVEIRKTRIGQSNCYERCMSIANHK